MIAGQWIRGVINAVAEETLRPAGDGSALAHRRFSRDLFHRHHPGAGWYAMRRSWRCGAAGAPGRGVLAASCWTSPDPDARGRWPASFGFLDAASLIRAVHAFEPFAKGTCVIWGSRRLRPSTCQTRRNQGHCRAVRLRRAVAWGWGSRYLSSCASAKACDQHDWRVRQALQLICRHQV